MNTRKRLYILLSSLLLALALTGCSPAKLSTSELSRIKSLQPPQGQALVYIIRPSAFGGAIRFSVTCDEQYAGSTMGSQFIYMLVAPGTHHLASRSENISELTLQAEGGKVYFVKQKVQMGIVAARNDLELVDEATGRKELQSLKLASDCRAYKAAVPVARL